MPKSKIISTIGPASSNYGILRKMMLLGMDVARLNFSHGNHLKHAETIRLIRNLNKKYSRHLMILGDLEGYRIRMGKINKEILLRKRQIVFLSNKGSINNKDLIPFDYEGSLNDIRNNSFLYIDDGNIALKVKSKNKNCLKTEVIVGGVLKEYKGINIPDMKLKFKGLTPKDKKDIEFSVRNKVDFIAQSFVRNKKDILSFKDSVKNRLPDCKIIAKIENRDGIKNIDEIIKVCDGIMIARGDMGVSIPIYEVPIVQKLIIRKCNQARKFVITATQMLESMTKNYIPQRSEVSDVANAILDGSDYLMLSAETAVGLYPVECVDMMNRIIKFTERNISNIVI